MLIVVKTGGTILKGGIPQELISDLKNNMDKHNIVFVHGGGVEVTEVAKKLGKEQRFIVSPGGFRSRYTDKETAEIYTMVMAGKINKQIVLQLQANEVAAVGLSGLDGSLLVAERKKRLIIVDERGRKRAVDGGYTGKICNVNSSLIRSILSDGYVPVIAPIAISEEYEALNVDGDRAAAYIAGFLQADKLILLTDVQGLNMNGKFINKLSMVEAKNILQRIGYGMVTKVFAAIEALEMGVKEVVISSGLGETPISSSSTHKTGTVISRE
jgi:acetylglutamate/LysW-gamma-L-alpha-aminoadipate kinase